MRAFLFPNQGQNFNFYMLSFLKQNFYFNFTESYGSVISTHISYFGDFNSFLSTQPAFFFSWRYNPQWGLYFTALWWALASSLARFLDHTQRRATVGKTPLN